jgi:Tol biopolymer transport system component
VGPGELCDPPLSTVGCPAGESCSGDCARCAPPVIERVSVTGSGGQADADSAECAISANGRYVAFFTVADLLPADTNRQGDVYVRDLVTNTLELVSVTPGGVAGNNVSESPRISGDGRWVAFLTAASDIAPGATLPAVVLRDRCVSSGTPVSGCTPATEVVSLTYNGGQPSGGITYNGRLPGAMTLGPPAVSADGRFVAFASDHTNLVADDTNICPDLIDSTIPGSCPDVFVRDRCFSNGVAVPGCSPTTLRVSVATDGTQGDEPADYSEPPAISDDGTIVAFASLADNLVGPTPVPGGQVYARNLPRGTTELVSVSPDGSTSNLLSGANGFGFATSGDGRFVAFASQNYLLVPGFLPVNIPVYFITFDFYVLVHDRVTGTNEMASLGSFGTQPDDDSDEPSISGDGRYVAFTSFASNLVPGDTNVGSDVFVHDRQTGTTELVSGAIDGAPAGGSFDGHISADGHWVCFTSAADNLLGPGVDTNGHDDVFVRKLD